jgi:membrane-associated protease RseP (regulator of RpoE activity)
MGEEESDTPEANLDEVLDQPDFQNFVAAQLTWDRAMAEALVAASERYPGALAVGIMGRGHVVFGHGVAHQMSDLGVADGATLLPIAVGDDCSEIVPGMADAVFLVAEPHKPTPGPLLGVHIESADEGVRVAGVSEKSVAEQAGIQEGDVITMAGGQPTTRPAELIRVIRRQAPGTWLPLEILRGERPLEIIAKFPTERYGHGTE